MVEDECRITLEDNPYYAWNKKGQTPVKKQKLDIHKGQNIFGALSIKTGKVIYSLTQKKNGIESAKFLNKVKSFKNKHYGDKGKVLLLWDNVSCHKSKEVKDWLVKNPNQVELDNFPPYSPEMNPIEHVWKELKRNIAFLRPENDLDKIMIRAKNYLNRNRFNYRLLGMDKVSIFKG